MQTELASLQKNETWKLVNSSKNQTVLTKKWVFKIKKDHFSEVLKYKTRWVIYSYKQIEDLDYTDIFTTVVRSQA